MIALPKRSTPSCKLNKALKPEQSYIVKSAASQHFLQYRTYAEFSKTLTPSPSPIKGEGNKKIALLLFSRSGRRGWGMRAVCFLRKSYNKEKAARCAAFLYLASVDGVTRFGEGIK